MDQSLLISDIYGYLTIQNYPESKHSCGFKELFRANQLKIAKAKAPIAIVIRQLDQPRCNFFILCIELALVGVTRLTNTKCLGHATRIHMPCSLTDFMTISLCRDGLTALFQKPPRRSRPGASPQGKSSW